MPLGAWYPLHFYGPGAAAAILTGTGAVSAGIRADARFGATLSGTGTVSVADMTAGKGMTATLSGTGALAAAVKGRGRAVATISIGARPSAEDIAQAVWGASRNINAETGTTVEALRNASSAGDPWAEVIEGTYTAAELLRIMSAALAGELGGASTTTITIKGVDGTTDRIVATVTANGDRTAVTLDGD